MAHLLDNLVWNALTTGNKNLSEGNDEVRMFQDHIGPFVGLRVNDLPHFKLLHDLLPDGRVAAVISLAGLVFPEEEWKVLDLINCYQMVWSKGEGADAGDAPDAGGIATGGL